MGINYNRKLFSNFISLSMVQGVNLLIPLLVMPYVISKVGAEGLGTIAVAQVLMIYLSTIADYGFNLSATKDIALNKDDNFKVSKIFFTVLGSKLLVTAVLMVILFGFSLFIPFLQTHFLLYALGFSYVIGQSLFVTWLFQGIERMHYITICAFLSKLIFALLVILFIKEEKDADLFLLFLGIGSIIAGLLSIFFAMRIRKLKFVLPLWADIIYELKDGWQLTLSNLSIITFLHSGIFILRIFTNDLIVGYYSIAERIFFAVRQVLAVFSQAIYPQICQFGRTGVKAGKRFFKQVYLPFLVGTVLACGALFMFTPQIIRLFIKDGSDIPIILLRLLSFVPVIVCLNIPAYQLLLAFDLQKSYLKVYAGATVINIAANILFVNVLGASGTAISIMITELFITIGLNRQLYKKGLSGFIGSGSVV